MKSAYLCDTFTKIFDSERLNFKYVIEAGSRDGLDSQQLSQYFINANIHAFECNPEMIDVCRKNITSNRITFNPIGLGEEICTKEFFAYHLDNNPGASSFYKRIDADYSQSSKGHISITTIFDYAKDVSNIDLLCMDVQGFELNILKGCKDRINDIKYIILEEPRKNINPVYLPPHLHSKYIGAPTAYEIQDYLKAHNFKELARTYENELEDNVLYKRL
jgi:FkbM family methyltransferase